MLHQDLYAQHDPERAMKLALGLIEKQENALPHLGNIPERIEYLRELFPNFDIVYAGLRVPAEENLHQAIEHFMESWIEHPEPDVSIEAIMVEARLEVAKVQFLQRIAESLETIAGNLTLLALPNEKQGEPE